MKKLIIFVGLLSSFNVSAESILKMPMKDYLPTNNYAMFEIKTTHFQKVVLDCQGFIHGMYFYNNNKYERQIAMDEQDCNSLNEYLTLANSEHQPVCLELNTDANSLDVTEKSADDCK
jgi:hypothetical protein